MKILLIGLPGSGKGTLSNMLVKNLSAIHLSSGEMFRRVIESNLPESANASNYITQGKLVPDDITNPLFNDLIMKIDPSTCKYIILDGYPRNLNQAMFLEKTISIDKVILLSPTINTLIKRLSGRRICPKCKEIYNIYFAPPKINGICDVCNSTLFQRKDDNEIAAEKRIIEYNKETAPLIDYYNKKNKLKEFDSSVSVEELYKNVLQYLKE